MGMYRSSANQPRRCCACGVELGDVDAMKVVVRRRNPNRPGGWESDRASVNICSSCLAEVDKAVDEVISEIRSAKLERMGS